MLQKYRAFANFPPALRTSPVAVPSAVPVLLTARGVRRDVLAERRAAVVGGVVCAAVAVLARAPLRQAEGRQRRRRQQEQGESFHGGRGQ